MSTITVSSYLRDIGEGVIEYSTDKNSWNSISWPITVTNNTDSLLTVEFDTDILINNINGYFICDSPNIQFGSRTLEAGGVKRNINITNNLTAYPGLIQNGTSSTNGKLNIYIYNLNFVVSSLAGLSSGAGWVAQQYFSKNASENIIINCSSNGGIGSNCGGIVGSNVTPSDTLYIRGCSSSGNHIGGEAGGIVGSGSTNITCESCFSTGNIGNNGGGIFGNSTSNCTATNCYSEGSIGSNGGGIFGANTSSTSGSLTCTATNCYSRGNISVLAGGIFGASSGSGEVSCIATNCYSVGTIVTTNTGIFGTSSVGVPNNCYPANGTWSNTLANQYLQGTPTVQNNIGQIWVYKGVGQPYELLVMGYTPYSLTNIAEDYQLVREFSQTVQAGQSSIAAVVTSSSFSIIPIGNEADITIDSTTGVINTTPNTPPGNYYLWIRNTGSYNITQFNLTVEGSPTTGTTTTCCSAPTPIPTTLLPYDTRMDNVIGDILTTNKQVGPGPKYASYADYIRTLKARCI